MGNHWMLSCFSQAHNSERDADKQFVRKCTSGVCTVLPTKGSTACTSDLQASQNPSLFDQNVLPFSPLIVADSPTTCRLDDPLLKVGQVVQKFAQARLDGASLKSMRHALELITEEWPGSFARIHIAAKHDALLLAGAASSASPPPRTPTASPPTSPRPRPLDFPMDSEHLLLDLQLSGLGISAALAAGNGCFSWRDNGRRDQTVPVDYCAYTAAGATSIFSVSIKMAGDMAAVLTFGLTQTVEATGVTQQQWPTYLTVMAASLATLFMSPTVPRYLALALAIHEASDLDTVISTAVSRLAKLAGQDGNRQLWFRVALTPPESTGKAVLFDVPSEACHTPRTSRPSLNNGPQERGEPSPPRSCDARPGRRFCQTRSVPDLRLMRADSSPVALRLSPPPTLPPSARSAERRDHLHYDHGVLRTGVVMEHSLLRHATEGRQRVLVPNIQKLLNHSGRVATDIFSVGQMRPPAAVLVVPLLKPLPAGSAPTSHYETSYGAVYCMSNVVTDFADVKAQLCEAVMEVLSPHLFSALCRELLVTEYEELFTHGTFLTRSDSTVLGGEARRRSMRRGNSSLLSFKETSLFGRLGHLDTAFDSTHSSAGAPPSECGSSAFGGGGGSTFGGGGGSSNAFVTTPASCTQALVTGLTDRINSHRLMQSMDLNDASCNLDDLQLLSKLGSGGYGCVFRGKWRGMLAAVKIVWCPITDDVGNKEVLKHAHEIAILSSVSHPNIVQAYNFMTDVCVGDVLDVCLGDASYAAKADPAFAKLVSMEDAHCHVQVLEYCDKASLAEALQLNWLQRRSVGPAAAAAAEDALLRGSCSSSGVGGGGSSSSRRGGVLLQPLKGVPPDMPTLLLCLLELASALAHLHGIGIVHCDIKPENVLLKSCTNDARGFTVKLADFGLSRVLDEDGCMEFPCNSCGTLAYVAPEALPKKNKVDRSIDVYSFGILMYEMYTNRRPYPDMSQKEVIHGVTQQGLRPRFSPEAHEGYVALARACWHTARSSRPSAEHVVAALTDMLAEVTRGGSS